MVGLKTDKETYMAKVKMDWLRLEDRIRAALKAYREGELDAPTALLAISEAVGEETGRGYPLEILHGL